MSLPEILFFEIVLPMLCATADDGMGGSSIQMPAFKLFSTKLASIRLKPTLSIRANWINGNARALEVDNPEAAHDIAC